MLTDACNLGTKDVGRSIESKDVNWDDRMDVQKGSGNFSNFFKDNVMGGGWWRKAKGMKNEERSNRVHFYFFYFFKSFSFFFQAAASSARHWSKVFSNSLCICRVRSEGGPGS